jgi:hypothetical protein
MIFCEIVVPIEISIPAKFYCLMATRFSTADIQSCQKNAFFGTSYRVHFMLISKLMKCPFQLTYYTNILSTVMYPRSSNLTFDLVFLKMRYFNFFEKNILCACNYYLKHLHISSWNCSGFGVCEAFYCEESLHLYR